MNNKAQKKAQKKAKINWTNTLFLTLTPLVGALGLLYILHNGSIHWQTLVLALILTVISGLGITVGYHRLFSHLAFQAKAPVRLMAALFGSACFEGSILEWCTDHRNHHLHTDTDKDPYNAKRGFWYSHIGWLIRLDTSTRNFDNVRDLATDPIVTWQHKHFVKIAIFMGFALPTLIAGIWGDWLGGFIIGGALRITFNQHATFCINSLAHIIGKQTYSDLNTAKDNWITALVTYGEGYHNFHHKFPKDYRNAVRFYQFDPSKWLIFSLYKLRLASDLRRISDATITKYRVMMDEKMIQGKLSSCAKSALADIAKVLNPAKEAISKSISKLEELEKSYKQLKSDTINEVSDKIIACQNNIKLAKQELKVALSNWKDAVHTGCMLAA
jgi:stearoyl-CoA desaturase (Delta-9 desaturase)